MQPHVDAPATKYNAFTFKAQPLFHSRMPAELDLAARSNYTVPRDRPMRGSEGPGYRAGVLGKSCGAGYLAVGRDLASWNLPDRREQIAEF